MTFFSTGITIPAPCDEVWDILVDVEKWPEWTESMSSVRPLGTGPMGVGARFEVQQPKLPVAKMTVVDWQPGHRFTWRSEGRAVWAVADHVLTPDGRECTLTLNLRFAGPLARIAVLFTDKLVRQYLQMEAQGLQAECARRSGAGAPHASSR